MKKSVSLVLAFCLLVALFAGCGNANPPAGSPSGGTNPAASGTQATPTHTFRMGHSQAPDHPFNDICTHFADLVSEKTGGAIQIDIFPNSQLGDEVTMLESLSMGTLDFLMANGANTAALVPELGLMGVCYLFDSKDHLLRVTDDQMIFEMYEEIVASKNLNLKLLNLMGNGMRYLYSTTQVSSLQDLSGMKIRVMPSAADNLVWNTLGATATTVAFNEVYSALQTHMVNGAENTFSSYAASKHNEVAPYVALTEHQWLVTELWAADGALNKLSQEAVTAIYEAAKETAAYALEHQLEVDAEYRAQLEQEGVTFTEVDVAAWKERVLPLHEEIAQGFGCSDILARINALR